MTRVIRRQTTQPTGWAQQQFANFVLWQRDLPAFRFWVIMIAGVGFGGYGVHFLLRGAEALQQGKDWSSLLATGNLRIPYVSVAREIASGSFITVFCILLLAGMVAARSGWLDRFVDNQ